MNSPEPAYQKGEEAPPVEKSTWQAHLDLVAGWVIEDCRSRLQAERAAGVDKINSDGYTIDNYGHKEEKNSPLP